MLTKKELRKEILDIRKSLDEETVSLTSQVVCRKILGIDAYEEAENICLYMPINNEIDVMLLAEIAEEDGKKVWLPKVVSKTDKSSPTGAGEMVFNRYEGEDKLIEGAYKIMESTSEEILQPDDKTLVVMPGAAFTPWRDRIGYGGGYYDRFLEEHPQCRTIAPCYEFQIVDEMETDDHDMKPDYLVSERSVYR